MAFDLKDENSNDLLDMVRKISKKYSTGFADSLEGKLAEQILKIWNLVRFLDFKEMCPLVYQMPIFDLKNQIMPIVYKIENIEELESHTLEQQLLETTFAVIFAYLTELKLRDTNIDNDEENTLIESYLEVGRWNLNNVRYVKDKLTYAMHHLVFIILEDRYRKSPLNKLDEKISNIELFLCKVNDWEESFTSKEESVKLLEKSLDKAKVTYDFLGLNKGFQQLYEQKEKELDKAKNTYGFVAATMFVIPFFEFALLIFGFFFFNGNIPSGMWLISIPFVTLILITLYLVKISLQDKRLFNPK